MAPSVRVGSVVKVLGIAGGTTTINAVVLEIGQTGVTVRLSNPAAYVCDVWFVDESQIK
jgi:hypothetical protein